MPIIVKDIQSRAIVLLNDAGSVRWPLTELLTWCNEAAREIALHKPSAVSQTVTMALAAGAKQTLPDIYHALVRVDRNIASGRAVTAIDRALMNAQIPGWQSASVLPFNDDVVHVIDDDADPRVFHVVPGNTGDGEIEIVAAVTPVPIAPPADATEIDEYTGELPLDATLQGAVLDYVLYRAFSKDTNLATAAARATAHYQAFAAAIGLKVQAEATANVNRYRA